MTDLGTICLVGVSHHSAPLDVRERLAFPESSVTESLSRLVSLPGVREGAVLSTCNRVEVVAFGEPEPHLGSALRGFLVDSAGIPSREFDDHAYLHENRSAIRHLFRVASSLDSLVVGEPQVLGQLKQFYKAASDAMAVGPVLHRAFHKAFAVAKRIRTETGIGAGRVSVSSVAVDLASQIFESLEDKAAMVVGAGKMSLLTARELRARGVGSMIFVNRTFDRAVELAREFDGTAVPWEQLGSYLAMSDVVIASAGGAGPVVDHDLVADVLKDRGQKPMFLIDLGVPRNFDPRINELANAYLYDVDDLEGVVSTNRDERRREADRAEAIVDEEVGAFWRWFEARNVEPTIVEIRARAESIRTREIERAIQSLGTDDRATRDALEAMSRAIVNKLLHEPTVRLRRPDPEAAEEAIALRRLFGIDED